MKRIGYIFDRVIEPENLKLAFWKASKGHRACDAQRNYAAALDDEIRALRYGLIEGNYPVGDYTRFTVYEPKVREVCAAPFRDRVLHHALMNVVEPYFDRWLVDDTYACRKGKGQCAAVERAQHFAHRYQWFLKCDFRKFFDSIPHQGIERMLRRKFKDEALVAWFMRIVDTYEVPFEKLADEVKALPKEKRGLPIGNLTSQHLANLFLDPVDRILQQWMAHEARLGGFGYVRYMDDFVFWSDDKEVLKRLRTKVLAFARDELHLALKGEPFINATAKGMDFLGMRIFPSCVRLSRTSRRRFREKCGSYLWRLENGQMGELDFQRRISALTAFTEHARSAGWRRKVFEDLESGEKRRVLATTTPTAVAGTTTATTASSRTTGTTTGTPTTTTASAAPAAEHRIDARSASTVPAGFRFPETGRRTKCLPPPVARSNAAEGLPLFEFYEGATA